MQINSLSTVYEMQLFGTKITSMTVKGDIKFPYEWQYSISYFCLTVECDLQGCLCHLRFKSCFQKWHCAALVSLPVRIRPLNFLGSLEYVVVLLNAQWPFYTQVSPRMCVSNLPQKGLSHGVSWEAVTSGVGEGRGEGKAFACPGEKSMPRCDGMVSLSFEAH